MWGDADFLINTTKMEYINLASTYLSKVWGDLYKLLMNNGIWSETDVLKKCKRDWEYVPASKYYDISHIMTYLYADLGFDANEELVIENSRVTLRSVKLSCDSPNYYENKILLMIKIQKEIGEIREYHRRRDMYNAQKMIEHIDSFKRQ